MLKLTHIPEIYIWHHDDADAKFYTSWDETDCSVCSRSMWLNTAARLAGWSRVTQQGVILNGMDGPCRLPWRTTPLALVLGWSFILNVHKTPSWATSRKEGMNWYFSRLLPSLWFIFRCNIFRSSYWNSITVIKVHVRTCRSETSQLTENIFATESRILIFPFHASFGSMDWGRKRGVLYTSFSYHKSICTLTRYLWVRFPKLKKTYIF
jgi:hypothetical protein